VRFSGCCPFGGDPGEVLDVEGDHDASLLGGESEEAFVLPTVEFAFLVSGADIVLLAQGGRDSARGHVRVEEQPHGLLITDGDRVDRRVLALERRERSFVLSDRGVNLLGELGVVGERHPDLRFGQIGRRRHPRRRVTRA
jgi:hypothetical protein